MAVDPSKQFVSVKLPGMKGWNAFDDPSGIDDMELADAQNASYQHGFISRREGSHVLYERPDGETGDPLMLIIPETSDGIQYVIAVYENHFYLRDEVANDWVRINSVYVPTQTDLFYGYVNWQSGRGDDRVYLCNGVDDPARWDVTLSNANGAQLTGAATLVIDDATRFPDSGILAIKGVSGMFNEPYTSHDGTTFTLTNTLDQNVPDGASVTMEMVQKSDMEVGKVLQKNQRRLFIGNYYGGETVVAYSVQNDPEDFTVDDTIVGGGTETIADGNGEITGMHDFGAFLVIEKRDSLHAFSFQISDDLGSKLADIQPITSGEHLGPLDMGSTIKMDGQLMYPTTSAGFVALTPSTSGDNVSTQVDDLSEKIKPFIDASLNLDFSRAAATNNKIWWAVARIGAIQNTLVVMYDKSRDAWCRQVGWAIKDIANKDDEIIYLDVGTGQVVQIEDGTYSDNDNEYLMSLVLKRFDYGAMGNPKNQSVVYFQGLMTPASEFFIDIYFNEEGSLDKRTYQINKDTVGLQYTSQITDEQGAFVLGLPILGMASLEGIPDVSFYRGFLALPAKNAFFNIQPRFYGNRAAFWGLTGIAMNPELIPVVPKDMLINPITV